MDDLAERTANLSAEKRQLLLLRIQALRRSEAVAATSAGERDDPSAIDHTVRSPIRRLDRANRLPVSFAQERLFATDGGTEPKATMCHLPAAVRLVGPLDIDALQRAINQIIARHEILRSTFTIADGRPALVVQPPWEVQLAVSDVSHLSHQRGEAEVRRAAVEQCETPFDLARGPLLRALLFRLRDTDHVLLLVVHHLVFDGWSAGILVRELVPLYEAIRAGRSASLPELPVQYADFASWERERVEDGSLDDQLSYWKRQLEGSRATLDLQAWLSHAPRQIFCCSNQGVSASQRLPPGAVQTLTLPAGLTAELKQLGQREGVTLFMTLLAALDALFCLYTGQEDVSIGSPSANRPRAELEGLIGFFPNPLVLRTHVSGDPSFQELLARVRNTTLEAYTHQDVPFTRLVEELQTRQGLQPAPLFQVLLVLLPRIPVIKLPGLDVSRFDVHGGRAMFNLVVSVEHVDDTLVAQWEYNTDLFDESTVTAMLTDYRTVIEAAVADPAQRLSQIGSRLSGSSGQDSSGPHPQGGLSDRERAIVDLVARWASGFVTAGTPDNAPASRCC